MTARGPGRRLLRRVPRTHPRQQQLTLALVARPRRRAPELHARVWICRDDDSFDRRARFFVPQDRPSSGIPWKKGKGVAGMAWKADEHLRSDLQPCTQARPARAGGVQPAPARRALWARRVRGRQRPRVPRDLRPTPVLPGSPARTAGDLHHRLRRYGSRSVRLRRDGVQASSLARRGASETLVRGVGGEEAVERIRISSEPEAANEAPDSPGDGRPRVSE